MIVACAQFAPKLRDTEANLAAIEELIRSADADLLVLPEFATTGYFFTDKAELLDLAEPITGPTATHIASLAAKHSVALVLGFMERADDKFYNSAIAFDSEGKLCGHYRKTHLFYYETTIFEVGDLGFSAFDMTTKSGNVRAGMLICYDWRFPEAARSVALCGAELIAMPSNIVTTSGMLHTTIQTRAFENKVVVAFSDRVGSESNDRETLDFRGESAIVNFNGEILAMAGKETTEVIRAEVDLAKTREKRINLFNDIFTDRLATGYHL